MLIKMKKKKLTESVKSKTVSLREDFFSWRDEVYGIASEASQIKTEKGLQAFFEKYPYMKEQYGTIREMNEEANDWTKSMLKQRKTVKMTESIIREKLHARKLLEDGESAKLEADDWYTAEIQNIVSKAISHSIAMMSRYPRDYDGLETTFQGKKDQLLTDAFIVWVEKVLPKELTWNDQGLVYSIIEKNIRKPYWNAAQKTRKDTSEVQTDSSGESYSLFDKVGATEDSDKVRIELDSYGLATEARKLAVLKAYFQGGVLAVDRNEMKEILKSLPEPSHLDKEGKVTNNDIAKAMGFKGQTDIKFYRLWNTVKETMK